MVVVGMVVVGMMVVVMVTTDRTGAMMAVLAAVGLGRGAWRETVAMVVAMMLKSTITISSHACRSIMMS